MSGSNHPVNSPPSMGAGGMVVRMAWMLFGPAVLLFSGAYIARQPVLFSTGDIVFLFGLLACIGLRYLDITCLGGRTATDNEPATLTHWWKYVLVLTGAAAIGWGLAHAVSYHFG